MSKEYSVTLKTRNQLVRYISAFNPPRVITETNEYLVNRRVELGIVSWSWDLEALRRLEVTGLVALVRVLEEVYGS